MLKKIIVLLMVLGLSFGLVLLTTTESRFEVRSHLLLAAPVGELWVMLADVDRWPDWWPGMEESRLDGVLQQGSKIHLRLKGVPVSDPALLTRVRAPQELVWEVPGVLGSQAGTRFLLEADAAGSRLTISNFIIGPQAFFAGFTGDDAFLKYQQKLLEGFSLSLTQQQSAPGEND